MIPNTYLYLFEFRVFRVIFLTHTFSSFTKIKMLKKMFDSAKFSMQYGKLELKMSQKTVEKPCTMSKKKHTEKFVKFIVFWCMRSQPHKNLLDRNNNSSYKIDL